MDFVLLEIDLVQSLFKFLNKSLVAIISVFSNSLSIITDKKTLLKYSPLVWSLFRFYQRYRITPPKGEDESIE